MARHLSTSADVITMSDGAALKQSLRSAVLARRDGLDLADRLERSVRAAAVGRSLLRPDATISGYWPIRSETDPRPLLAMARSLGGTIALPVLRNAETMDFLRWDLGVQLVPAGFGTIGPPPDAPVVDPDIMLAPLAAFDRNGHRIGYGKGHYDRAIAQIRDGGRRPLLVGLAFAVQEVEKVPFETHDIPLDFIVTEDELIAAPGGNT